MSWSKRSLALLGGLAASLAALGAELPEGMWAGSRMRLVIDANGATVETDCANGRIFGPIRLTPSGTFAAGGTYEQPRGGPQRADDQAPQPSARYAGEVKDDVMTLSILPAGAVTAQVFSLRKGATVKLLRCL